jgi:hypothetical protein
MAEIQTRPTGADVTAFLEAIPDDRRRGESLAMRDLMERVTGAPAEMWGPSIVGFGSRPYVNSTGSADYLVVGFAPRKGALTLYGVYDDYAPAEPLFGELGPHTTGKGCLYLKRLDAVDSEVLERLIRRAWERSV